MRTAKALGRKAGFGLCSKFAIALYVVIIVMFYGIATLTISNQAAKRRIDTCEKSPPPRQCAPFCRQKAAHSNIAVSRQCPLHFVGPTLGLGVESLGAKWELSHSLHTSIDLYTPPHGHAVATAARNQFGEGLCGYCAASLLLLPRVHWP